MKNRATLNTWWTVTILAMCVAILAHPSAAAAEEPLYPHAESQSGPWGYIDKTGRIVVPLQYQAAEPFSEGSAAVKRNNKFGFIDRTGRVVIDFQFERVQPFRGRRSNVRFGNTQRLIDEAGRTVTVHDFTSIESFSEDRAVIIKRDSANRERAGVIDPSGQLVVKPEYERILPFSEGLAAAQRDGRLGFIDRNGKVVIPFQYGWVTGFHEGRAKVWYSSPSTVTGFIDRKGNLVIPFKAGVANEFSEGLATVEVPGKGWGAIDGTGTTVIKPQFSRVGYYHDANLRNGAFSEGLLAVSNGQSFGYIDKQGVFVVQPQFVDAAPFGEGLAVVRVRSTAAFGVPHASKTFAGVIDRTGRFLIKPIYDSIKTYPGGVLQVRFDDRLGYFDSSGRPLTLSSKDIEDYIARKRRQLEEELRREFGPRPAPGRGITAKAGDVEYYLSLPENLCALDDSQPADRTFIEDVWAEQARARQRLSALKPSLKEDEARTKEMLDLAKSRDRFILPCDQLARLRSGAGKQEIASYITATGRHTDHYDMSSLGGAFWGHALMCLLVPGDVFKRSKTGSGDESGSVATAFERLKAGKPAVLRTMEMDYPAFCYYALIVPPPEQSGSAPDLPMKAKLASSALLSTKDWTVHLLTRAVSVASADDFWQAFERDRTLLRDIGKANPLK